MNLKIIIIFIFFSLSFLSAQNSEELQRIIDNYNNSKIDNNDNVETKPIQNEVKEEEKEPINETITETIQNEPKEDIKDDVKDDVIAPPNTPKTKTKTQELIQCQRCKRWVTEKTLKFTHDKVCKEKADVYIPKTIQNKRNKHSYENTKNNNDKINNTHKNNIIMHKIHKKHRK